LKGFAVFSTQVSTISSK